MIKQLLLSGTVLFSVALSAQTNKNNFGKSPSKNNLSYQLQDNNNLKKFAHCGTDEAMENLFKKDPEARLRYEAAQKEAGAWENVSETNRNLGNNSVMSPAPAALDTIPIVFHILHQGGPENITNQEVYNAVAQLNIDYQKLDADTSTIEPFFQARATACNLVFQLATKDPNGNCTNGIIRHYDANTMWNQNSPGYAYTGTGAGKWNPSKYLNIYIVKDISDGSGSTGGTIVGYTYRPGTFLTGNAADCIVYNYAFLDVPNKEVRSLAHEIGHWFNLAHTFGSTNNPGVTCGDDNLGTVAPYGAIDDTPKTVGFFSTCPAQTPNSCDASNYANVENIMDYSSCPKMFTLGQCRRMRYTLTTTASGRNNLVTAANKLATGIRNPLTCIPVAEFKADKRTACVNTNITFSDSTTNSIVTSYQWDFPGGTPSTSTAANPVVTYAVPGNYAVTYTATNSAGSNSISKTSYITIGSSTATYQTALVEGFESITVPNADWTVDNNGAVDWYQNNTVGATGNNCMALNNFSNAAGEVEQFYTPSFNLSAINTANPTITFTFKLAYQRKTTAASEKLQVFSSTNCGQTWSQRYSKSGASLATVTAANTSAFVPTPTQWRTETVSISAVLSQPNILFKFVFTADAAGLMNNIYIDDINISNNSVGITEANENSLYYTVFPNPNNGTMSIDFNLDKAKKVRLELVDLLGKTLDLATNTELPTGAHHFEFGKNMKLASGIYFSKLTIDGKIYTQKVIVE